MAQSGLALTPDQAVEIISMYSSSAFSILAVASAPGWNVVGTFPIDVSCRARLDAIACVSDDTLTLSARLYCVTPGSVGEVPGTRVTLNSMIDARVLSTAADLVGGRLYQVQAQVVGDEGDDFFGIVRRAAPSGST